MLKAQLQALVLFFITIILMGIAIYILPRLLETIIAGLIFICGSIIIIATLYEGDK